jgi:hypothetical protein
MNKPSDENDRQDNEQSAENQRIKDNFLYSQARYYGEFTPGNLAFNANLQEFAQRVSIICNLETGGKLPPNSAYQEIKKLWKQLKDSKSQLLDQPPPDVDAPDE